MDRVELFRLKTDTSKPMFKWSDKGIIYLYPPYYNLTKLFDDNEDEVLDWLDNLLEQDLSFKQRWVVKSIRKELIEEKNK
jgi:hypothetical protein